MNVGERYKRVKFSTYPHETKELVNVVNVVQKYFCVPRTRIAKQSMVRTVPTAA